MKPSTKSGKDRSVALIEPWLSSLKRMKEVRKLQQKLPDFKPEEQFKDLVYLKDNGKPFDPNEDNELWIKVNKTYNAKRAKIRQHGLRHIAATKMADSGVEREVAMALLGTRQYCHFPTTTGVWEQQVKENKSSFTVKN